jgi:hypothetical protein
VSPQGIAARFALSGNGLRARGIGAQKKEVPRANVVMTRDSGAA